VQGALSSLFSLRGAILVPESLAKLHIFSIFCKQSEQKSTEIHLFLFNFLKMSNPRATFFALIAQIDYFCSIEFIFLFTFNNSQHEENLTPFGSRSLLDSYC
jgi:hypothetical protein